MSIGRWLDMGDWYSVRDPVSMHGLPGLRCSRWWFLSFRQVLPSCWLEDDSTWGIDIEQGWCQGLWNSDIVLPLCHSSVILWELRSILRVLGLLDHFFQCVLISVVRLLRAGVGLYLCRYLPVDIFKIVSLSTNSAHYGSPGHRMKDCTKVKIHRQCAKHPWTSWVL